MSVDFLAFSDVHAHPFPYGASYIMYPPFEGLHNSRLIATIRALEGLADYAIANNIKVVTFSGDLYHTRTAVKTVARSLITHVIHEKFVKQGLTLVMIPGNHDYADRVGYIHSLQSLSYLSPNVHVMDTVRRLDVGTLTFISVPYSDGVKKARTDLERAAELAAKTPSSQTCVLLAHLGVQGARVGSDYVLMCPSDVDGGEIPFASFDLCLFGHYHQHQAIAKNAWFVGALTQQNWSDTNGNRGFLHIGSGGRKSRLLDGQTRHLSPGNAAPTRNGGRIAACRIDTGAPRFVICEDEVALPLARECDFVTFHTTEVLTDSQQQKIRDACKAVQVDIKPVKTKVAGVEFDASQLNAETALRPWIAANTSDDFETDELLTLGKELLAEGINN